MHVLSVDPQSIQSGDLEMKVPISSGAGGENCYCWESILLLCPIFQYIFTVSSNRNVLINLDDLSVLSDKKGFTVGDQPFVHPVKLSHLMIPITQ